MPIAFVGFVVGFLLSFFIDPDMSLPSRLGQGAMMGGMALVASFLLLLRDEYKWRSAKRKVTEKLLAKPDVSDDDFCRGIDFEDHDLLLEIRRAIADFYGVPAAKIHPNASLRNDLRVPGQAPALDTYIICRVLEDRSRALNAFELAAECPERLEGVARVVQRAVDASHAVGGDLESESV